MVSVEIVWVRSRIRFCCHRYLFKNTLAVKSVNNYKIRALYVLFNVMHYINLRFTHSLTYLRGLMK